MQICESIREGAKVRQVIVRHVGVAKDDAHLEELKRLAKAITTQIQEEREGPYLFPIEHEQDILADTSQPQEKNKPSLPEKSGLHVNLDNFTEEKRVVEGFRDVFGSLFHTLGFSSDSS